MKIAILGATSQIARDLILSFSRKTKYELSLFARRPDAVKQWLLKTELPTHYHVGNFSSFGPRQSFDVILNFVGVGNPAKAAAMGATIFNITTTFDDIAISYIMTHPECRYVFLSSGAAYGSCFSEAVGENTIAEIPINNLSPQNWYGVAKLYAECRHRSLSPLSITDIRVFNYFSHTQEMSARYLMSDIMRAIKGGTTLVTSQNNAVRDYIGPDDFFSLLSHILNAPPINDVFDCYTQSPVDKFTLLQEMNTRYGLTYRFADDLDIPNATGAKLNYYSTNYRAAALGYQPSLTSLQSILRETSIVLK